MRVIVGAQMEVTDPDPGFVDWCRSRLILDNPDYYKKQRMGLWTGNTPETIKLYEKIGNTYYLPFGCWKTVKRRTAQDVPFYTSIKSFQARKIQSSISLYPYQEKAVEAALNVKNGVIVMPCGSGKTQTALEIVARLGGRTLWLTHTHDLLMQSMRRAKSVLDLPASDYGTITEGAVNVGFLTFATVQTMAKVDLKNLEQAFDVVIVDECQHCCGTPTRVTQFYKVLSALSCRYKFGLTATPYRADGLEPSMYALLGEIVCEVSRAEVVNVTCPVHVRTVSTGYFPQAEDVCREDGVLDYAKLVTDLTLNGARFDVVVEELSKLDGRTMVLANRVNYLLQLCVAMQALGKRCVCLSGSGSSKKAKRDRDEALKKLNAGELDCIFASYKLAAEGLDCPNLRYIVFATPEKDTTTVIQSAGRVARKAEGKDHGEVVDFVDDFGMYRNWAKRRKKIFENLGFSIDMG